MPYVTQEQRPFLDYLVGLLGNQIKVNGDLNYVLFAFCKRHVEPSYNNYKNFCGELRQCATEIERRILGPYEDEKIVENGDVE
jgi:hypothetical protein